MSNKPKNEALMGLDKKGTTDHREESEGAPRKRGPLGLFSAMKSFVERPEVHVWASPVFRALGICGVLGCVAFLGKQSEEETNYGALVEAPSPEAATSRFAVQKSAQAGEGVDVPAHASKSAAEPAPCAQAPELAPAKKGVTADGRIIMNEATADEFTQLPGVGEARAEAIVQLRQRMGKFRNVTDLLRVRGIGWKTLQAMKEKLVVDRPIEEEEEKEAESEGKGAS